MTEAAQCRCPKLRTAKRIGDDLLGFHDSGADLITELAAELSEPTFRIVSIQNHRATERRCQQRRVDDVQKDEREAEYFRKPHRRRQRALGRVGQVSGDDDRTHGTEWAAAVQR